MWREYERATTTIVDAYTRPLLRRFLSGLERGSRRRLSRRLAIMKSNGGRMLAAARSQAVQPCCRALRRRHRRPRLRRRGGAAKRHHLRHGRHERRRRPRRRRRAAIRDRLRARVRAAGSRAAAIDIVTIGAGGGSIAWVDDGGLLRVGPRSAGAEPGPACYGRGGTEPTVTDANLVLGRLDPGSFLGGDDAPRPDGGGGRAWRRSARRLGLDAVEAGAAVIEIANENMASAIRRSAVERGVDPARLRARRLRRRRAAARGRDRRVARHVAR